MPLLFSPVNGSAMKTKILTLTLMIGLAAYTMAQTAPPAGTAPAHPGSPPVQNQTISSQNITNFGVSTNNINPANTNLLSGTNWNNGATNGNVMNGMIKTVKGNPFATYTNPNSIYTNPNSVFVNPNSTNINPNFTKP
jgi:hypothetical protein